jgi:hypothetical protein
VLVLLLMLAALLVAEPFASTLMLFAATRRPFVRSVLLSVAVVAPLSVDCGALRVVWRSVVVVLVMPRKRFGRELLVADRKCWTTLLAIWRVASVRREFTLAMSPKSLLTLAVVASSSASLASSCGLHSKQHK